ncbi:hypothetical protein BDM02DRAFT_3090598 [Thelephora ganbajun]|uniref:Uncharacterized protein n=1 Tax=Thelephora ganbajun TaxID=370292 RepID=A0ACB6ZQ20_THEGA|nr:hypothetical protein BDM02DRAFT_3090598 [Thelephora ganbajun]
MSSVSVLSRQATALEICDMVYGNKTPSWEAIEHYYEPSASEPLNPFVTATSREILADISSLTCQLSRLDIPRPIAMLHTLLRLDRNTKFVKPWFRALEVWSEIDEILESDTFDGHHRTIVEHTLHVLFLPNLHKEQASQTFPQAGEHWRQLSMASYFDSPVLASASYPQPKLSIAGINLPSPMHFQLRVLTRLSMNEQGRITHHRDFWDVKDLLGLVPGVSLAQWVTTRITGYSLSLLGRFGMWVFGGSGGQAAEREGGDVEIGPPTIGRVTRSNSATSATTYARHVRHHHSYSSHRA